MHACGCGCRQGLLQLADLFVRASLGHFHLLCKAGFFGEVGVHNKSNLQELSWVGLFRLQADFRVQISFRKQWKWCWNAFWVWFFTFRDSNFNPVPSMHYVYHLYRGCINTRCVCNVFRFLVEQGCIPPLCDLLTVMDSKIVQVALNGLENILRLGEQDSKFNNSVNPYSVMIEECYGGLQQFFLCCVYLLLSVFDPRLVLLHVEGKSALFAFMYKSAVVLLQNLLGWAKCSSLVNRHENCVSLSNFPRREAGDVWCLPPVWNLRAVIWFHLAISSLVLLPSPVTLSVLSFSACWPFLLNFFQKILQYFSLRDRLFCVAPV